MDDKEIDRRAARYIERMRDQVGERESMALLAEIRASAKAIIAQRDAALPIGDTPMHDGRTLKDLSAEELRELLNVFETFSTALKFETIRRMPPAE